GRHCPPDTKEGQQLRMTEAYSPSEEELSSFLIILLLTVIGTECIIGILANGFIAGINAAEWVQNKVVSTSGRILFFLSVSRIALQIFMMLEITFSSTSLSFYYEDAVYDAFKISFLFLNFCSLWFAAWLSFFYYVKILKWRISALMPWLLWLSVFISLSHGLLFYKDIYTVYCNNSFPIPSSNSRKKKYFSETYVVNLAYFYNLGILVPLIMFILAATLLILSLKRHTLHMGSNVTGSRDSSMEAHVGTIRATSYFLILYIVNAVALFLYISNIFDVYSFWTILSAYPAGHSVLLIQDSPGLRRAWKWLRPQSL
uniref:Taste receptor type 2 n=1 Tax=Propithecus coquereli TaxID=379532 RepID=A0A2K6ELM5_PROCO